MTELTNEEIEEMLTAYELAEKDGHSQKEIKEGLKTNIEKFFEEKAVLGFDVVRYSQYDTLEQTLLPSVLKSLYKTTIRNCLTYETFFFDGLSEEDFKKNFIDLGDGGFQIFNNPFQAVIFAIYFQTNIKRYNSGWLEQIERKIIGEITLRYCLTYDKMFSFSENHYGPSIINNGRIMSKDKLNRFLIDENSLSWFTKEINGIENLQLIKLHSDFKEMDFFKELYEKKVQDKTPPDSLETLLFTENKKAKVLNVDILRIGEIKSKLDILSIHSLHIQSLLISSHETGVKFRKFANSLGNLNPTGLAD